MTTRRGAEWIVEYLADQNIPYIFMGPVGHTNLELLHATEDRDDVDVVMSKHELVAGYMACGYHRVTNKPGVVSTHTTPGLGNALNQFAGAYLNSSAVVDLHSDSPAEWRGQNSHHEIGWGGAYDMADPVTKETWDVTGVDKLSEAIPQAFDTATSGRPGPVLVNLPMDVLAAESDDRIVPHRTDASDNPVANDASVSRAVEQIVSADSTVLLAGGGTIIADASDEVVAFAEEFSIPVATTDSAKGVIPEDHPNAVGVVGGSGMGSANRTVKAADLVLAVGTRFGEFATSAWTHGMPFRFPEQDLIQIDINPEEIGRHYTVDVGIVGDARESLQSLRKKLSDNTLENQAFLEEARENVQDWQAKVESYCTLDSPLTMGAVIATLREHLPRDAIVTADSGKNRGEMVSHWEALEPRTVLMDSGNGAMGYGPCAALGAKAGAPDRNVVSVSGDGGFLMVNNVLPTAVEYDLPVTWIVLNDQGFVSIAGLQDAYFGGDFQTYFTTSEGDQYDIAYAEMAESFDVNGRVVETPEELTETLSEAISDEDEPYLLDVRVSREGAGVDNGAQWVQAGRGTGTGESK